MSISDLLLDQKIMQQPQATQKIRVFAVASTQKVNCVAKSMVYMMLVNANTVHLFLFHGLISIR